MHSSPRSAANAYASMVGHATVAPSVPPADTLPRMAPSEPVAAGAPRGAAIAYARVGLETGVTDASPHQLILMLFEGAELAVRRAIRHAQQDDKASKTMAVSKACTIITEGLRAALDIQQGGEIAQHLDALYDYMTRRLMLTHASSDTAPLEEVLGLLEELHGAWKQIGTTPTPHPHA